MTYHQLMLENQQLLARKLLERVAEEGLSSGQPKVLEFLLEHDGCMQKEIAHACSVEAASVTSLLNKMERDGLVQRKIPQDNRRVSQVWLTEAGRQKAQMVRDTFTKLEENCSRALLPGKDSRCWICSNGFRKISKRMGAENNFMEYAQIVFYQLVIFVIYGAIGVAAVKGGILDEAGLHAVSRVVIKVTLPVMLFTNTVSGVTRESLLESLPVTGATAVMYLLLALLCWGMSRAFGLRGDKASVFMASTMFGNVGFIGIPIIAMLFPERGMLYIAAFTIVDQPE